MKKISNLLFIPILGLLIFNFFIKNRAEANPQESYDQYLSGKAVFIDVREESEVKQGMVKGALWFPLSKMEENKKAEIEKIKLAANNKDIFVYCHSGNRSSNVQSYLKQAGVKSVNMGGFNSLVGEKIPTQSGPE